MARVRRSRISRRRRGRRGFWGNFSRNYKTVSRYTNANHVWTAIDKLKDLVNSEMFKLDQSNTAQSATNAGSVIHITAVAQGDGDGNRTGSSILARYVNIRGTVSFNTLGNAQQFVRLMVIQDTQQVPDTSPSVGDVLDTATTYGHMKASTVGRYKVIRNLILPAVSLYRPGWPWEIRLNLGRHHVRFNGTTASDVQKGGLYFAFMSNSGSNYPTIDYNMRLSYHDN